jgi:hypothetical protein
MLVRGKQKQLLVFESLSSCGIRAGMAPNMKRRSNSISQAQERPWRYIPRKIWHERTTTEVNMPALPLQI